MRAIECTTTVDDRQLHIFPVEPIDLETMQPFTIMFEETVLPVIQTPEAVTLTTLSAQVVQAEPDDEIQAKIIVFDDINEHRAFVADLVAQGWNLNSLGALFKGEEPK